MSYADGKINDGGERMTYGEGLAMREPSTGKGRYDLVTPFGIMRLAKWYELGSKKYSKNTVMDLDCLTSYVKQEVDRCLSKIQTKHESVSSAEGTRYTDWECVALAMRRISNNATQDTLSDNAQRQDSGVGTTQTKSKNELSEGLPIRNAESELQRQNDVAFYGNEGSHQKPAKFFWNGNSTDAQSVRDHLKRSGGYILTMTMRVGWREDTCVAGATTASECLKTLSRFLREQYNIYLTLQVTELPHGKFNVLTSTGRNWEKGMPFSRYIDSAKRHLDKFVMGMEDEDHLAAAAWNILAIIHHEELGQTQFDDMPHYLSKSNSEEPEVDPNQISFDDLGNDDGGVIVTKLSKG